MVLLEQPLALLGSANNLYYVICVACCIYILAYQPQPCVAGAALQTLAPHLHLYFFLLDNLAKQTSESVEVRAWIKQTNQCIAM